MRCGAVVPEHIVKLLDPHHLSLVEPSFKAAEDNSIRCLRLPVCLGVLDRCKVSYGAKLEYEFLEVFICELCPLSVMIAWGAQVDKDVLLVEIEDVLSCV